MIEIGISILAGFSIVLLIMGLRPTLLARYRQDCERIRTIAFRFHPQQVKAERWVLLIYAGAIAFLAVLILITPSIFIGVALWGACLLVPNLLVEYAWQQRRKKIEDQLPATIASMANCVRAGLTLVQAIQRLADSAPEPARSEYRVMHNRYAYGSDLESTILETKQRLNLRNFNLFASALLVNREIGGDIAKTLDRIATSLIKLAQMRRTVEVHTSEGRMSIKVLMVAPVMMLLLLASVDSAGVALLFSTLQGWCILIIAGLLSGGGLFWAMKIVHSEV